MQQRLRYVLGLCVLMGGLRSSEAQLIKPQENFGAAGVVRIGNNNDDSVATSILSDTAFTFYGKSYNGLTVSTNGVVTFGSTNYFSNNGSNKPLPIGIYPGIWVAQDDWRQTDSLVTPRGFIYYKSYADGIAITWAYVRQSPGISGPTNSFQAFLYNNGDIGLGYDDLSKVDQYVVGLNKGDGTTYASLSGFNTGQTAFNETGYASISRTQYLFRFNGENYVPDPLGPAQVSGKLTLLECLAPGGTFTFEFRPTSGAKFTRTATIDSGGAYTIEKLPKKDYQVWIKGVKWLAEVIGANALNGNVTGADATLLPGDSNNDNHVDIFDLATLAEAFNSGPTDPNWNENCDFNCSGGVDVFDLATLAQYFNTDGDL